MPLEVPHGVPPWELQPRQPSLLAIPLTEFAMQLAMPRSLRQLHEWEVKGCMRARKQGREAEAVSGKNIGHTCLPGC